MKTFINNVIYVAFLLCASCFASNNTITFPNACSQGHTIVIAAVGDVLLHQPLQTKASKKGFRSLWQAATPYLLRADIAYANLEGPIARGITESGRKLNIGDGWDKSVYTNFPTFNYHPSLARALKDSGIDIVSTANNHALDRFSIGIDKTIEALNSVGLIHVGTRLRESNTDWFHILNEKGFKIAWISCTETTNDNEDKYHQVLRCYRKSDKEWMLKTIRDLRHKVDAVIVTPHWGEEYQKHPEETQVNLAHQFLNAGALAVVGSHPHVLQPIEKYTTEDGRPTLIVYSLGNFVSYQGTVDKRATIILLIGLTKTPNTTVINGMRFVPMYMENRSGLDDIQLVKLTQKNIKPAFYSIFDRVLPMGNMLYSDALVTNPECIESHS